MFEGFSSGLKLTDLNDFITPSQECIKPIKVEESVPVKSKGRGFIEIEDDAISTPLQFEKAKITLNDCLACSGCITSAEVVLVNQQSFEQLNRVLKANVDSKEEEKLLVVLSVSPQAILSIAARYNMSPQESLEKTVGFFKSLGIHYVFDISFARCFSIIEAQKEFVDRYRNKETCSSIPMLASACPGWVCYAEKTHGSFILPYISRTRSPQQVMGALLKEYWAPMKSLPPNKIYHVTLMPCFDKKLEASRDEFFMHEFDTHQIDCVITPVEVEQMLEQMGVEFSSVEEASLDPEFSLGQTMTTHDGSGSGGFAHHVFTYAAQHLFGIEETDITWTALRNNDMQEVTLEVRGETLLRFGVANGFRNIQNLVQKLKRKKSPYHFVEVMACPSGCLNGGAQIRPTNGKSSKELVSLLESLYSHLPKVPPDTDCRIQEIYSSWIGNQEATKSSLYTTYKEVEKNVNPLGIKW